MIRRIVFVGVMAAAVAVTAAAQGHGGGGGRGGSRMDDSIPGMGAQRINRMDLLERMLTLNKDQRKEVRNIMDAGQKDAAPLRDQMTKARAEVAAAVESGKPDAVDQAVKSYAGLETKMAAIEMKAFAEIYKLLDADQQQKTAPAFQMMHGVFGGKNWTEVQQ